MHNVVVENLYQAFKHYKLKDFKGPLDLEDDQARHLASTPLRSLSIDDLDRYAFKALSTWGSIDDFKHFLPRLLELALLDPRQFNFFEVLLGKLHDAEWQTWPADEKRVVEQFLMELWRTTIDGPLTYEEDEVADTVLCGIGRTRIPLQPFLAYWLKTKSEAALQHLAVFVSLNAPRLRDKRKPWNSWWQPSQAWDDVAHWLRSHDVRERLHENQDRLTGSLADAVWQIETISPEQN